MIDFYIEAEGKEIYMFTQHYTTTVYERFRKKCRVEDALKFMKVGRAMDNLNEKLPKYIRYIEKEEGIEVLKKTKAKKKRRAA